MPTFTNNITVSICRYALFNHPLIHVDCYISRNVVYICVRLCHAAINWISVLKVQKYLIQNLCKNAYLCIALNEIMVCVDEPFNSKQTNKLFKKRHQKQTCLQGRRPSWTMKVMQLLNTKRIAYAICTPTSKKTRKHRAWVRYQNSCDLDVFYKEMYVFESAIIIHLGHSCISKMHRFLPSNRGPCVTEHLVYNIYTVSTPVHRSLWSTTDRLLINQTEVRKQEMIGTDGKLCLLCRQWLTIQNAPENITRLRY